MEGKTVVKPTQKAEVARVEAAGRANTGDADGSESDDSDDDSM